MCGITGIYAFNELGRMYAINLHRANEALAHRGPDAAKLYTEGRVGLGHRRLSILDLSPDAHQPMYDDTGRYVIVFNGEIFNFAALRDELAAKGVTFRTQSDTEVLLNLYRAEGEKCLEKLNGFFALAIYDQQEDLLFLARDRAGIKPLWYYQDEDKFLFSSEMRSLFAYNIRPVLDYASLHTYFQLNYIPAPYTLFRNTFKLPPAHWLKIKGRQVQMQRYYDPPHHPGQAYPFGDYGKAQERLIELLEDAIRLRLVADVPVGAFLSGGIDSSTVVALAARHTRHLRTFSIGFRDEPRYDETRYAEMVARHCGTEHQSFSLTAEDLWEKIPELLDFYGEPFADSSAIPTYILCRQTRRQVTVALSGDGADELFGGYHKYTGEWQVRHPGLAAHLLRLAAPLLEHLPKNRGTAWGNLFRRLHRFAAAAALSPQERYWFLSSLQSGQAALATFSPEVQAHILASDFDMRRAMVTAPIRGGDFNEVLYADTRLLLPNDMLHKVDSMSMAHSLEVRVPFLDYRLINFAFSLPPDFKVKGNAKKRLLRDAARPLLPAALFDRPKQGFDVPLARGYRTALRPWIQELLDPERIRAQGIFDPAYTERLKHSLLHTQNFDQNQAWAMLAFQHWHRAFGPMVLMEEPAD